MTSRIINTNDTTAVVGQYPIRFTANSCLSTTVSRPPVPSPLHQLSTSEYVSRPTLLFISLPPSSCAWPAALIICVVTRRCLPLRSQPPHSPGVLLYRWRPHRPSLACSPLRIVTVTPPKCRRRQALSPLNPLFAWLIHHYCYHRSSSRNRG